MARKSMFSDEVKEYIKDNAKGRNSETLTEMVNSKFRTNYTTKQISLYKKNKRIKSNYHKPPANRIFTDEMKAYCKEIAPGRLCSEMTEMINSKFGTNFTVDQVKGMKKREHITSGLDCTFQKGAVSPMKGKHFPNRKRSSTVFKKGNRPHNAVPVGTELINSEGYHKTKIAEPNVWEFTHRLLYKEKYGKIPEGCMIIFKDGNKDNISIDNLMPITSAVHLEMIQNDMRSDIAEITEINATLAKLNVKTRKIKKKLNDKE